MSALRRMVLVLAVGICQSTSATASTDRREGLTSVYINNTPVINVVVGSNNLSAAERTALIQRNLNIALMVKTDHPQVTISQSHGEQTVQLNGLYVASADAETARAMDMTATELAHLWAKAIRTAMSAQTDSKTISSKTSTPLLPPLANVNTTGVQPPAMRFARVPAGTVLPVVLEADFHTLALRPGDGVAASTTSKITLPSGETLSAGTRVFGDVTSTSPDNMFGPGMLKFAFERLQLKDGTQFPISTSLVGDGQVLNNMLIGPHTDLFFPKGHQLLLKLNTPAQIAVSGTAM